MAVSTDEKFLALSLGKEINIMQNPLTLDHFAVYGPSGEKYKFMSYIKRIMVGEYVEHDPNMDKWIIQPYSICTMHIYAYFNMSEHIRRGLEAGGPFYPSKRGPTPMTISIEKNFSECISAIFKVIDKMAHENMFCFYYLERSIVDLNYKGFSGLDKFYRIIFRRSVNTSLPKFCDEKAKLPVYISSDFIIPKAENFMKMDMYTKEGKAIMFMQTLVKLNLTIGSNDSLHFLDSLKECEGSDVLETPLIQFILEQK